MRLSRFAATTSALLLSATLALTGAGAAHSAVRDATPAYTALGDSYSSGVGAGSYDSASGNCKRSTRAHPALWAAANAPSSFHFTACSGARTGDVVASQLGPLNASTGLVSVSVGGNDAGFADVMTTCVLSSESTCLRRVSEARAFIADTLPGRLDGVYDAIAQKAVNARVVVLGYPRLYKLGGSCFGGLSERKRAALNAASDQLNTVTEKRAADHGFTFGDVASAFNGHEICSGDSWLHSTTFPVAESYHPTAAGQSRGYLPVLDSVL
ncbi:SGNH/GDSL hydrolase family protein [Streptomyces sp. H27-D2]|uniref:SGNH/GDSL hydrolase family protein n=1 Tax=Streptomyces sp. H27-D2 TaxID=3046304 RepID=UPI002DBC4265|nr:SGNH/GDSL hydrolase family protein [Streptomyces sp. H27-D2]MEC4018541.1 SGNH/GDSL hydrolase family protein [Streptomyces sp. H27-D2]